MAANPLSIASATHLSATRPLTFPDAYAANLLFFVAASGATSLVAALGIWFRRKRGRIRLIQKSARPEGIYWVPNVPILSAICIIVFCVFNFVWCPLVWLLYMKGNAAPLPAIRVITLLLPFPLFVWAHFASFGPVYACHLFPLAATSAARPRLAKWLRFKPCVVNGLCFLIPILAMAPTMAVAIAWAVQTDENDKVIAEYNSAQDVSGSEKLALANQWTLSNERLVQQYTAQWAMWAICYTFSGFVYVLYSALLLPTLQSEIQNLRDITSVQATIDSIHIASLSRHGTDSGGTSPACEDEKTEKRPQLAPKRPSWLSRQRLWSFSSYTDSIGGKITKFELLKRNSRIAAWELGVFAIFCFVWSALSLFKAIRAKQVLQSGNVLAVTLMVEAYAGLLFGFVMCALICRRGYNTTRVDMSPNLSNSLKAIVSRDLVFLSHAGPDDLAITIDDAHDSPRFAALDEPTPRLIPQGLPQRPPLITRNSQIRFALSDGSLPPLSPLEETPPKELGRSNWSPPLEWSFDEAAQRRYAEGQAQM